MKYSKKIALSIVAACLAMVSQAQVAGDSARYRSQMFAVGSAKVLDTYLSAEQYSGFELRYI
ncbi:MAG: DUF3316 domain-containing protein, partial [Prevotella sp.]|nr:DUF3316 domain-containing protein [Prevotella sp.]